MDGGSPAPLVAKRICVLGGSCAGKTTLSKALASILGVPHIELDSHFHGPNWTQTPSEAFVESVEASLADASGGWVIDGNYHSKLGSMVLERAEAAIFLDLPFRVVFRRAVARSFYRLISRQELWNGNREELRFIFTKDWIPLWVIRTHGRQSRVVPERLALHSHLRVIHLRSQAEVRALLEAARSGQIEAIGNRQR